MTPFRSALLTALLFLVPASRTKPRPPGFLTRGLLLLLAGLVLCGTNLDAQTILRVLDAPSGNPIPQALVSSDALSRGYVTGLDGLAVIPLDSGEVSIGALGYEVAIVTLTGESPVEVRLTPRALALDSLIVEVEGGRSGRALFSERRARGEGIFLDPLQVQLKIRYRISDLFYELEGVRGTIGRRSGERVPISTLGTGCFGYLLNSIRVPLAFLREDPWTRWPLSSLAPEDIMAVEVYRFIGEVPPELRRHAYVADQSCGLIVIWAKEAW